MEIFDRARKLLDMNMYDPRYNNEKCAVLKELVAFNSDNEEEVKIAVLLQREINERNLIKEPAINVRSALSAFKQVYIKGSIVKTILGSTSLDAIIESRKACYNFIDFANKSCQSGWHDEYNEVCSKYANYLLAQFYKKYKDKEPYWEEYYMFRNYCIQTAVKGLLDYSKINNLFSILEVMDNQIVKLQDTNKDLKALNMFEEDKTRFLINENAVEFEISRYLFKGEDALKKKCEELSNKYFNEYKEGIISEASYNSVNSSIVSSLEYYLNPGECSEVIPIDRYYRVTNKLLRAYDMTIFSKEEMMKSFVFAKRFLQVLTKEEVVKTVVSNAGLALIEVKDKYPTIVRDTKKLLIGDIKKLFNNGFLTLEQYYKLESKIENS